jgi:hypothetical protein
MNPFFIGGYCDIIIAFPLIITITFLFIGVSLWFLGQYSFFQFVPSAKTTVSTFFIIVTPDKTIVSSAFLIVKEEYIVRKKNFLKGIAGEAIVKKDFPLVASEETIVNVGK